MALPRVLDYDGDFGSRAAGLEVIPNDGHDLVVAFRHECLSAAVVDLGEMMEQLLRRLLHGLEESQVHGLGRQPEEQSPQAIDVVVADGADGQRPAFDDQGLGPVFHAPVNAWILARGSRFGGAVRHACRASPKGRRR